MASVVVTGLSMPHSPRWHQGRHWLLNSGSGELGWIEHDRVQPLCALPGFIRGHAFAGDCAVIELLGLPSHQFTGLALDERLAAEGIPGGCCGLRVVDLATRAWSTAWFCPSRSMSCLTCWPCRVCALG